MPDGQTQTIVDLGRAVKAKYPQYADMDDAGVGKAVKAKFPGAYDDYSDIPAQAQQQPKAQPSMLQQAGGVIGDLATGAAKGAQGTIDTLGQYARHIPGVAAVNDAYWRMLGKDPQKAATEYTQSLQPTNTAQSIGHGLEQAAEFLIPGAGEEKAAQAIAGGTKMLPLAKTGMAALGSGLVNKAQGGDFSTGAIAGGVGGALGEGMRAVAPKLAESAIGIRKTDRTFGKTPGDAILNETNGVRPGTIAQSAKGKIAALTPQIDAAAAAAQKPVDLNPALGVIDTASNRAMAHNNVLAVNQLNPMRAHLTQDAFSGQAIPASVPPTQALALKRGFGEQFFHPNPDTLKPVSAAANQTYRALDSELDKSLGDEAAGINQRISSLIPVAKRAESASRNASMAERVAGRMGRPTGALIGSAIGGAEGYREHGAPGAVVGSIGGLLLPEMLAQPTTQMIVARGMASPAMTRAAVPAVTGLGLQMDRKKKEQQPRQ